METLVFALTVIFLCLVAQNIVTSPFNCPQYRHTFDARKGHGTTVDILLDNFLIQGGYDEIQYHQTRFRLWKRFAQSRAEHSILRQHRLRQFNESVGYGKVFEFRVIVPRILHHKLFRRGMPYRAGSKTISYLYDYETIQRRYEQLKQEHYIH